MPFRDNAAHLRDILEAIDHVEGFLTGMDFSAYKMDLKTKSAVERQMQIITEAAKRLGDDAEALCPGPDWRGFAVWATSCGMAITKSMMRQFGIR